MEEKEKKIQRALGILRTYSATLNIYPKPLYLSVEATSVAGAYQKALLKLNSKQRKRVRESRTDMVIINRKD